MQRSTAVLILIGKVTPGERQRLEIEAARRSGKRIIPVLVDTKPAEADPGLMMTYQALTIRSRGTQDIEKLVEAVSRAVARDTAFIPTVIDPEDLNKGQFGGKSSANQREVTAQVDPISDSWFRIHVTVRPLDAKPLTGVVQLHLDPATFSDSERRMAINNGIANYQFGAWGAFTIGIVADAGKTRLELDLATLPDAPEAFRTN